MSASLNALIPELQASARELLQVASDYRLQPRVTSTLRSRTEQERLYRAYTSGRTRYPAAPPGQSAHEFGYAFDLLVTPYDALYELGPVWESWGGKWGGRYGDEIHFEYPGFNPSSQLATLREVGGYVDPYSPAKVKEAAELYYGWRGPWWTSLLDWFK